MLLGAWCSQVICRVPFLLGVPWGVGDGATPAFGEPCGPCGCERTYSLEGVCKPQISTLACSGPLLDKGGGEKCIAEVLSWLSQDKGTLPSGSSSAREKGPCQWSVQHCLPAFCALLVGTSQCKRPRHSADGCQGSQVPEAVMGTISLGDLRPGCQRLQALTSVSLNQQYALLGALPNRNTPGTSPVGWG